MTQAAIRLSAEDNVAVCCRTVEAGEEIMIGGLPLIVSHRVTLGHKLALRALSPGEKVFKYGAPIGSITEAVGPGEWVHLHNMTSDYLPAHLRDGNDDRA